VAEAIHCPSCTTRYRLRPERLKPVIRRAKCFTCGSVFPIGDVVRRLMAVPAEAIAPGPEPTPINALDALQPEEPTYPDTAQTPSLTLSDLENTDPGFLENTLVAAPYSLPEAKDSLPEVKVEGAKSYPPEITDTTLSGYTSARDAIDKLFGAAPGTDIVLKLNPDTNLLDLEATLAGFEDTLGASLAARPSGDQETLAGLPTDSALKQDRPVEASTSTISLSQADVLAAIAVTPARSPVPAAALNPVGLTTAPLRTSNPMPTEERLPVAPRPVASTFAPLTDSPDPSEEMLRLKIGDDIYTGLTMPQLIAWVEQGRILENHLVARQHSENWLESQKVPGLRPVFERLRRERNSSTPNLDPGLGDQAPKKSLFGGLFGKN
jgi:predicted Zn finger-like uncharacterized protein